MPIINNILELALKKNISAINPNDYADPTINSLVTKVNAAAAAVESPATVPFYGGYAIPAPKALMQNPTGTVTVGETSTYCSNAGNCCLWTVPAGVTKAQFQIWGAGGNGSACDNGACCWFAQSGGNGEYTYVTMAVTPGQTYTLCAGGGDATTNNSCYVYCTCYGCNSFVCGSNSTCILSCGGNPGMYFLCGSQARDVYPSGTDNYASVQAGVYSCSTYDQCRGKHFGDPSFRCDGTNTGCISSSNTIYSSTKIPSIVAGVRQCGNSICYMCHRVPSIDPDHTVCLLSSGWNGYDASGCCLSTCATFNKPGIGGPGAIASCYQGPTYGSRGRSGLVIVKYK